MNIEFKGDKTDGILNKWISKSMNKTYPLKLRIVISSHISVKDELPLCVTSMCIYEFTCSCGAHYIGHTKRSHCKRISEHYQGCFLKKNYQQLNKTAPDQLWTCYRKRFFLRNNPYIQRKWIKERSNQNVCTDEVLISH